MALVKNLTIRQGTTYNQVVRWESSPFVYKAITAITKTAPAVLTVPSHGVPDGWRAAVVSVQGMTEINTLNTPPKTKDFKLVTVVDANTLSLNTVNSAEFSTYVSGGYIQFYTPTDLTGYTARMAIKDRVGGTELLSLTNVNGRITIDEAGRTITLGVLATDTEDITWKKGVYDLEMVGVDGTVTTLLTGAVTIEREVTT